MRWLLLGMLALLTFGFIATSGDPSAVLESRSIWDGGSPVAHSWPVVAALLTPALLYIGVLFIERLGRMIGWPVAALGLAALAVGVGAIGIVGFPLALPI